MNKIILSIIAVFIFAFVSINIAGTDTSSTIEFAKISAKRDIRTDTIHVDGNCNMCKKRIENAALIRGVKKATWNKYKDQLVVIYDANKTTLLKIEKAVAEVGHDTPHFKADDKVYSRLPKCCLYREKGAKTH